MTTYVSGPTPFSNADDASYRGWISTLRDSILGTNPSLLTLAPDTGQVDTATVLRPVPNLPAGPFNIFKFSDGLGPALYIRLDYVMAGVSTWLGGTRVSVGTETDGAGNFVPGKRLGTVSLPATNITTTAVFVTSISIAPGFVNVVCASASGQAHLGFCLCRTNDNSGAWTDEGAILTTVQSATDWSMQSLRFASGASEEHVGKPATLNPFGRSSWSSAGETIAMPVYCLVVGQLRINPAIIAVSGADVAINTEVEVAVAGLMPSTFKRLRALTDSGTGIAFRWE